jgi:proteic killer suppression protein
MNGIYRCYRVPVARGDGAVLSSIKGDLAGKRSIRINDQWRVVFRCTEASPEDVGIIDYH